MARHYDDAAQTSVSDYELIGGGTAISLVVDRFYQLVLADERLASFFVGTDMPTLKRHQVLLVSQVMGGPAEYAGRDLRQAHAGMQISPDDFARVVSCLVSAMQEAQVPPDVIERVGAVLAGTEPDVVAAGPS